MTTGSCCNTVFWHF